MKARHTQYRKESTQFIGITPRNEWSKMKRIEQINTNRWNLKNLLELKKLGFMPIVNTSILHIIYSCRKFLSFWQQNGPGKFLTEKYRAMQKEFSYVAQSERGDVPGWVLVVLMTTGLVTGIWTVAQPRLSSILKNSLDNMNSIR